MCGILGFFTIKNNIPRNDFQQALLKIIHRGPDNQSVKEFNNGYLGHTRLSIIDPDPRSNQPFSTGGRFYIVFNGEIYNFSEIRSDLQRNHSVNFTTSGDTEVLLQSYITYGTKCLQKLNGMFAFAIFDRQTNSLFLARDRVGKKPLYYTMRNGAFIFASELKAMLPLLASTPALSHYSVNEFLSIGYITSPNTIYETIYKLEPAHFINIDLETLSIKKEKYWDPLTMRKNFHPDDIHSIIEDAVKIRFVSDVPVGLMLSGGLDSNIVLALSKDKKPKTFTIKMDRKEYDESGVAQRSSNYFGCENRTETVTPGSALLNKVVGCFDEPFGDSSAMPTLLLSEMIKNNFCKCVLNGDGGDEVFAGYDRYRFLLLYSRFSWINYLIPNIQYGIFRRRRFFHNLHTLKKLFHEPSLIDAYAEHNLINKGFQGGILKMFDYKQEIIRRMKALDVDGFNRFILYDYSYYLPDDLLVKMDRAAMANSLETRSPLLDYRLAEIFLNVDFHKKISLFENKKILRKLFNPILPEEVLKKPKTGFQIPLEHWFFHEIRSEILELKNSAIVKAGFVTSSYLTTIIDAHIGRKQNFKFQIYTMLILNKWLDKHH